jgi:hypothetical protein
VRNTQPGVRQIVLLDLTRYAITEAALRSKGARRCADSGLSHGESLCAVDFIEVNLDGPIVLADIVPPLLASLGELVNTPGLSNDNLVR